jgi:hypothetical protein
MEIKNTELHTFEGVAVGRVFNFENGNSISVDVEAGEIYSTDGGFIAKAVHVEAIKSLGVKVQLRTSYKDRKGKIYALYESTFEEEMKLITKGVDFDPDGKKYLDSSSLAWKNTISRIEKTITKEKQL